MSLKILGTGSALPARLVTNNELSGMLDTSDEWITTRTGIRERRVLARERLEDIAYDAAKEALFDAGKTAEQIDMIIASTVGGDYKTPSLSCMVQKRIGGSAVCFDINAACSGFVYALDIAAAYFGAGRAERILIVCAEAMSTLVDWTNRSTCVLFGDAAGAAVVERGDALLATTLRTKGEDSCLYASAGFGNSPFAVREEAGTFLKMNGKEIYKFALEAIEQDIRSILQKIGRPPDDVSLFLLHQANKRIIESARLRLDQPEEKFPTNIARYGNTSSASIPVLLDEQNRQGALRAGDILVLSAFGAGLTNGACAIRWTKN